MLSCLGFKYQYTAQVVACSVTCCACMQILMVAPTAFGFNEQTAQDNHFMHEAAHAGDSKSGALVETVTREFAGLHHVLSEVHGVHLGSSLPLLPWSKQP